MSGRILLAAVLVMGVACGDDAPAPKRPKPAKKVAAGKKAEAAGGTTVKTGKKAGKAKTQAELDVYQKIEDLCPSQDDAASCHYRRELKDADFVPDPSGELNRDPFRSYVIRQGVVNSESTQVAVQETKVCTDKNSRATSFLLRDLRLIGIVLKGTKSYAMFRDRAGLGWSVHRGDCLGKEQARVQAIGIGSVTLEVIPEAPANAPAAEPTRQEIALYPEDIDPYEALANPSPESVEAPSDSSGAPPPAGEAAPPAGEAPPPPAPPPAP